MNKNTQVSTEIKNEINALSIKLKTANGAEREEISNRILSLKEEMVLVCWDLI